MEEKLNKAIETLKKDMNHLEEEIKKSAERRNEYRKAGAFIQETVERSNHNHLVEELSQKDEQLKEVSEAKTEIRRLTDEITRTAQRRREYREAGAFEQEAIEVSRHSKLVEDLNQTMGDLSKKYPDLNLSDPQTKKEPQSKATPQSSSKTQNSASKPVSLEKGIAKSDIESKIKAYEQKQRNMWNDGPDMLTDAEKKEFDRINTIMPVLKSLLDKNKNAMHVSMGDIESVIAENKKKMNDLWASIVNSGEEATPQEEAAIREMKEVISELESLQQEKQNSQTTPASQSNSLNSPSSTSKPVSLEKGIAKSDIEARIKAYEQKQRDMWNDADVLTDADKREFERMNNVLPVLRKLVSDNENSRYVAREDINAILYDSKEQMNDLWATVQAAGDGATPQEQENLTKLNDIVRELESLSKMKNKENTSRNGGNSNSNDNPDKEDFPRLDININKKTGEVLLIERDEDGIAQGNPQTTWMDSNDYKKETLQELQDAIEAHHLIKENEKKYLKHIDPTIYKAYLEWDTQNMGRFEKSASEMYVKSVITRARNLERGGKRLPKVEMPGKVTADVGWHPTKENKRTGDAKGFLGRLITSYRANKRLKYHGPKRMHLATIKDNRWIGALIGGVSALVATGTTVALNSGEPEKGSPESMIEGVMEPGNHVLDSIEHVESITPKTQKDDKADNKKDDKKQDQTQEQKATTQEQEEQEKKNRLYPGDKVNVTPEVGYTYNSSDAQEVSGAITNTRGSWGVNKMAVVMGDQIYTTDTYSADELYDMATNNPNASIRYHVDRAMEMNGRMVVETNEVGNNVSPVYVYNDNGVTRTIDGREWKGDVEHGAGWMDQKDLAKAQQQARDEQAQQQDQNEQQATRDNDMER